MKNSIWDLIENLLVGLIIGSWIIFGAIQYQTNKRLSEEINQIKLQSQMTEEIRHGDYINLKKQIKNIPDEIKLEIDALEAYLMQVNVFISNKTVQAVGSGVTLKYKDNFYVLSAGHLMDSEDDILTLNENGQEICELELVKQDYTLNEIGNKGKDLLLLRPKDRNIVPRIYTEIADYEPKISDKIYIVGNTLGMEDIISEARVLMYEENFMYIKGDSYFGNSGGGIFNKEGKLIGIMSHIAPITPYPDKVLHPKSHKDSLIVIPGVPAYVMNGVVRLREIIRFLEGVELSE